MEKEINKLYLSRKNKLILNFEKRESIFAPIVYLSTMMKNIESLGFTFSSEIIDIFKQVTADTIIGFYQWIIPILKEKVGDHKQFNPMYPNFPKQVMEASYCELYINAILHYLGDWIGTRIMPEYEKDERFPLIENTDLTVIELGTKHDFHKIFVNLMQSKTSISDSDKKDIAEYIRIYNGEGFPLYKMPFKEIRFFVLSELMKYDISFELIKSHFDTATDILRFATALSDGDISLAKNTKFISFNRKTRRLLLELLDHILDPLEDMKIHRMKWIRLGERLHPGEYKKRYIRADACFYRIRSDWDIETYNSKVEFFIENADYESLLPLLQQRPGVFARRLDHILRISFDRKELIVKSFKQIADKLTTPTLLQLISHFDNRQKFDDVRVFFPKGNAAKLQAIPNTLEIIPNKYCLRIIDICGKVLLDKFSSMKSLGSIYIDPDLRNYLVPFSQRSANKALKTIVRGSKIPLGDKNIARFFLWWKDQENGTRVDIDLTAVIFDSDWQYKSHISYTNLKDKQLNACHSGDITSAPNGACEFIDIDIDAALRNGSRYVVMNLYSYTEQSYCDLPECFAGWMTRFHAQSGEIFEARTVQNKFDIASNTKICIPLIIDLKEKIITWADLALMNNPKYNNNVESNYSSMALISKAILSLKKPNLYDLFYLHATARGLLVNDKLKADMVFAVDDGITPFDFEIIISKFL